MNSEGSFRTPWPNVHLCTPALSCLFQYSEEGCFIDKIKMVGHDNLNKSFSIVVAAHGAFSIAKWPFVHSSAFFACSNIVKKAVLMIRSKWLDMIMSISLSV
jgi:hypothetical protein